MTERAIAQAEPMSAGLLETVVVQGDLAKLTSAQRLEYYARVCESVGLNPLTKPFLYITLNNKLTLYAARDATDQIRDRRHISVTITSRDRHEDVYVVTARATTPEGRTDESIGAVAIADLKGEALANALMKAETKAKRRVTLSIGGLGWLDETEVATVADAVPQNIDMETGEYVLPKGVVAEIHAHEADVAHEARGGGLGPHAKPAVTDDGDALWTSWCNRVAEAEDLDLPVPTSVVLPIDRDELVGHINALTSAIMAARRSKPAAKVIEHDEASVPWEPDAPTAEAEVLCEDCRSPLTDTTFKDGKVWTVADLAAAGKKKFGAVLCMKDYSARNAKLKGPV